MDRSPTRIERQFLCISSASTDTNISENWEHSYCTSSKGNVYDVNVQSSLTEDTLQAMDAKFRHDYDNTFSKEVQSLEKLTPESILLKNGSTEILSNSTPTADVHHNWITELLERIKNLEKENEELRRIKNYHDEEQIRGSTAISILEELKRIRSWNIKLLKRVIYLEKKSRSWKKKSNTMDDDVVEIKEEPLDPVCLSEESSCDQQTTDLFEVEDIKIQQDYPVSSSVLQKMIIKEEPEEPYKNNTPMILPSTSGEQGISVLKSFQKKKTLPMEQHCSKQAWSTVRYTKLLGPYATLEEAKAAEKRKMFVLSSENTGTIPQLKTTGIVKRTIKKPRFFDEITAEKIGQQPKKKSMSNFPSDYVLCKIPEKTMEVCPPKRTLLAIATKKRKKETSTPEETNEDDDDDDDSQSQSSGKETTDLSGEESDDEHVPNVAKYLSCVLDKVGQQKLGQSKSSETNAETFDQHFSRLVDESVSREKSDSVSEKYEISKESMRNEKATPEGRTRGPMDESLEYISNDISMKPRKSEVTHHGTNSTGCCCAIVKESITRYHRTVLGKLNAIINLIGAPDGRFQRPLIQEDEQENLLPDFPLQTLQCVETFNLALQENEDARAQFRRVIMRIGGANGPKFMRNCLASFLSDDVCRQCSWTGKKNTYVVGKSMLITQLIETILVTNTAATRYELQRAVKDWLRRAGDRVRYANKRLSVPDTC